VFIFIQRTNSWWWCWLRRGRENNKLNRYFVDVKFYLEDAAWFSAKLSLHWECKSVLHAECTRYQDFEPLELRLNLILGRTVWEKGS